jgi:hypothetical protein
VGGWSIGVQEFLERIYAALGSPPSLFFPADIRLFFRLTIKPILIE